MNVKVSLGSGAPGPEKVIERILRESQTSYDITRTDLFIERDGVFHPAFAVEGQEDRKV